ncbi:MAG TPA: hypothetical protein VGA70_02325, partial [Longimicrobiales bacterium]
MMKGPRGNRDGRRAGLILCALAGGLLSGACGAGVRSIPPPRPLVVFSGVRLQADSARLQEVHGWAVRLSDAVETDPSFWLITDNVPEEAYPWETIEFRGADSVRIAWEPSAADVQGAYWVYSFLHLMTRMDRMDEWFPD